MIKHKGRKLKYIKLISAILWLIIWELAAHLTASVLLLPSPYDALKALIAMAGTGAFYLNLIFTIMRCMTGIVASFMAGSFAAAAAFRSQYAREFFRIPVSFFKSIPVMAIVIYVILVVKSDMVSVAVCFLMCFPISYSNILAGLDGMKREYMELAAVNGLTRGQIYRLVLIPMLRPQISSALALISGMSWKVVVASEVLSIPRYSIGYEMLKSKYYLDTPQLFAYMSVLVLLSLIMENVLGKFLAALHNRTKNIVRFVGKGKEHSNGNINELVLKNITKSYQADGLGVECYPEGADCRERKESIKVLDNYSESFGREVTAILGPSGRGKTTIARLISGLEKPDKGEITQPERISYLFQEDRLLPWLSVESNMLLGVINESGLSIAEAENAVNAMAEKLEIVSVLENMPHELSGGMAHRVALGRALLRKSDVLILDEPFRGIDEALRGRLTDRLREDISRSDDKDRTVILITHEESVAEALADRILRI